MCHPGTMEGCSHFGFEDHVDHDGYRLHFAECRSHVSFVPNDDINNIVDDGNCDKGGKRWHPRRKEEGIPFFTKEQEITQHWVQGRGRIPRTKHGTLSKAAGIFISSTTTGWHSCIDPGTIIEQGEEISDLVRGWGEQ